MKSLNLSYQTTNHMKKLMVLITAIFITQASFAQSNFDFGIKAGLNLNKIHTDMGNLSNNYKESLDTKTGFSAGVFARIGNAVYLQPEVLYTERSGNIQATNGDIFKIKYKSIDVPLLVGIKLVNFLRINAGPVANIKIHEKNDFLDNLASATEKEAIKNATFGYQAGAGISLGKIDIDVRKEGSLGTISTKHFQDAKFNQKLDGWQVALGLRF